jgi:hypothetical protein
MKKITHNKKDDAKLKHASADGVVETKSDSITYATSDITAAQNLHSEIQKRTEAVKNFNDKAEKDLQDLEIELNSKKRTELSESVQIANDSKEMDNIDTDFDTSLIDIYADVVDKVESDL